MGFFIGGKRVSGSEVKSLRWIDGQHRRSLWLKLVMLVGGGSRGGCACSSSLHCSAPPGKAGSQEHDYPEFLAQMF